MQHPSPTARLQRLQDYLRQDPGNAMLLADACECAIAAGEHDLALEYVATAERQGLDPAAWQHRRSHLCIARGDLQQAAALLAQLQAGQPGNLSVLHDRAYVQFLGGDFDGCRALLAPALAAAQPGDAALEAAQALWLRATHRSGHVQEGCAWARAQAGHGGLQPAAQGVASLLAIDGEDFTGAEQLARAALAVHPGHPEALVAQASVDLARNRPDAAIAGLRTALAAAPHDGRTLGTMGFALLRAQDLPAAQEHLEAALLALPGHIGSWHALGWTRLLRGDRAGALAAFEAALQLDRNFAESHGGVGLLLALTGDAEGAERHLLLADKLDARNVTARFARAVQQGALDDPQRLQALARRLLDQRGFFGGRLSDGIGDPPAS